MIFNGSATIDIADLEELAAEIGFTSASPLAMDALEFRTEVRDMCSANTCRSYGMNWRCPPAAGSLESIAQRTSRYHLGILVQTTGRMKHDFDYHAIRDTEVLHKKNFETFARQVRMLFPDCFPMSAGACTICRKCTYPDRPCRHPDRSWPSMEACGLVVNDVCKRSGLRYNYGNQTITFTSCILID